MPKINAYQTNFTAGELSPRMYARSDIDAYSSGLKQCVNMITRPQGPVSKRPGMKYLASIEGTFARVFPFQLTAESSLGEAFPLIMSDNGDLAVYGAQGSVAGEEQLDNPSFDEGGTSWTVVTGGTGAVVFSSGVANLTAPDDDAFSTEIRQAFNIDPSEYNQDWNISVSTQPVSASRFPEVYVKIGTTPGGDEISIVDNTFNTGTNSTLYVTIGVQGGNYMTINIPGEPPEIGTYTRVIEDVSIRSESVFVGDLVFAHTWDEQDLRDAWYAMPPSGEVMYILTPLKRPYKLSYNKVAEAWTFDEMTFINKPSEWGNGSWPSCVTFFQGRSWWSGVANAPEKIWSSVSAQSIEQYERFSTGAAANDSVIVTNAKRGKVRWIEGLRNLVFGTVYGEFIVTSDTGIITPDDVRIEQQSANGSAMVQTIPVGNTAIYTSGDKTKLRTSNYQWTEQAWLSKDVTFTAEHIGVNHKFEEGAYARNPDGLVWFAMADGTMSALTFETYTQMTGWHRHITDGNVLSVSSIEAQGESEVYLIVDRGHLSFEKMSYDTHLDSFYYESNANPVSQITGLTHLASRPVSILIDGAMYAGAVDAGGVLNLPRSGRDIYVGIPFDALIERLPHEGGSPMGTALLSSKRNVQVRLLVNNSVVPLVNGKRPKTRMSSTPMGQAQPLYTGYVDLKIEGYTDNADLVISDNTPYRLNISGIYTAINMEQQI